MKNKGVFEIKRISFCFLPAIMLLFLLLLSNETVKADNKTDSELIEVAFDGLEYLVDKTMMSAALSGSESKKLEVLTIPDFIVYENQLVPVTEIYDYSFFESGIKKVCLGDNINRIGEGAFAFCRELKSVIVSPGLTEIGKAAFFMCANLKSLTDTGVSNLKSIGEGAFSGTGFVKFTIKDSVEEIGESAFAECASLKKVVIGSACRSMGNGAFSYCTSLKKLTVAKDNTSFISNDGCIYTSNKKRLVSGAAASGNLSLKAGLKKIEASAFEGNTAVESISVPEGVSTVSENAFRDCISLKRVDLPASIKTIDGNVFLYCSLLSELSVTKGNKNYRVSYGMLIDRRTRTVISAPVTKKSVIIPSAVLYIGDFAFCGNTCVTKVNLNNKLKAVGQGAFYGCSRLKTVSIPKRKIDFSATEYISEYGETLFCGIFGDCSKNIVFEIPYDASAGSRGSIEYYLKKQCNNGVIFKE